MRRAAAAAIALSMLGVPRAASADAASAETTRAHLEAARREGDYRFCAAPKGALKPRQAELCSLAAEAPDCEGLARACREGRIAEQEKEAATPSKTTDILASIARLLVWGLAGLVLAAALYPLVRLFLRARRDKALQDPGARGRPPASAPADAAAARAVVDDAEEALRIADAHVSRGELDRAMSLYLAASLVALDRRGAIRLAKHRTNGEYVRLCTEEGTREPLRAIVREVDRLEFGKASPSPETTADVAARAKRVVRAAAAAASVALVVFGLTGCHGAAQRSRGDDPAGDELPRDVLRRSGFRVGLLETSLATVPMPSSPASAPMIFVDMTRVPLEEESEAHLLRWVEAGGVLVLVGAPSTWPGALEIRDGVATTRELTITGSVEDDPEEKPDPGAMRDPRGSGSRVASPHAFVWPDSEELARLGDARYAARRPRGAGFVVVVAGTDLFTNVGTALPANAVALVELVTAAGSPPLTNAIERALDGEPPTPRRELRFARAEDGIPPPSNPFASLAQAGLGRGLWHALAATAVLFLAYGIRRARPRHDAPARRRAFVEHVEATGAFYGRTRAMSHALAAYGRFVSTRLRDHIPRGTDPVAFLAQRTGAAPEEVMRLWARARDADPREPPRGDELAVIRDLRSLLVSALARDVG